MIAKGSNFSFPETKQLHATILLGIFKSWVQITIFKRNLGKDKLLRRKTGVCIYIHIYSMII